MLLQILYWGNPILRKRAEPVKEITEEIKKLIVDMIETMDANDGIGLAAPQVGVSIRLFVLRNYIELEDGKLGMSAPQVYINPKIKVDSKEELIDVEGCLSIPGIHENVIRPSRIIIEALDFEGNPFSEVVEGYNARVRMHENELDPILRKIKKKYNP
jgi:peptide deformylase